MRLLNRARAGKKGSVMVLFTLMLPTLLIPLVGLAIDATIARLVQAKLQAAVDGAALGAGRLLGTPANAETVAAEFLASNFRTDNSAGSWGAHHLASTIVYTPGITKKIEINATAQVPLLFMRVLGHSNANVSAAGTATRTDSRVMFVLDRSGSMTGSDGAGSTVIEDAKAYAAGFVQKFTESADELGLVVYDGSSFVAYPTLNPNWSSDTSGAGGPNSSFNDPLDNNNMVNQIGRVVANGGQTGTAEALWTAYIELQKTHLRDLAADGVDYRLNSIVLLTDGLPQSVTVWPNNPADVAGNAGGCCGTRGGALKVATACNNRITAVNPNPTPIVGWVAVSRNGSNNFNNMPPLGLYQPASTDPAGSRTSIWWAGQGRGDEGDPNPSSQVTGCTGLSASGGDLGSATNTDFGKIPSIDRWGNSMCCATAYKTASQFVDANGNAVTNPLAVATTIDQTQVASGNHWALAFWNAVDDAARRIRMDVNRPNRVPADPNNMAVAIYVIGYSGNGGLDQGLLKRVANDKLSSSYDATQPTGLYVPAGNKVALQNAFNTVYSAILRLAK